MKHNYTIPAKLKFIPSDNKWHVMDKNKETAVCEVLHCGIMRDELSLKKGKVYKGQIKIELEEE